MHLIWIFAYLTSDDEYLTRGVRFEIHVAIFTSLLGEGKLGRVKIAPFDPAGSKVYGFLNPQQMSKTWHKM